MSFSNEENNESNENFSNNYNNNNFSNDISMNFNPKLFTNYLDLISEYQLLLRELSLEYIRLNMFNYLPSRKKSFWLIRNDNEQLNYWMNKIDGEKRLFEVEINLQNGKIYIILFWQENINQKDVKVF